MFDFLSKTDFWFYTLLVMFLFTAFFMTLLVLIQRGRGGGITSAFGGMGAQTAFGAKTGDVLTWVTACTFAVFLVLAITLNLLANQINESRKPTLLPSASPELPLGGSTPATPPPTSLDGPLAPVNGAPAQDSAPVTETPVAPAPTAPAAAPTTAPAAP